MRLKAQIFLLFLVASQLLSAQIATIKESKQMFKTYDYSDPDPVARITSFYPYFRFDGFTNESEDKEWTIIILENEYIKVLVAPEMGGKVLGAIDKSSGEEFIYFNKVVKFRDISMRGAWTSGGIEFNFGSIGHAPTTASPVNYLLRQNSDGSVSCFVGAPEITSRTEWRVEIRLQSDKSYFETRALWYNPYELNTSLYNWMTASVDATDDLEYYFPGTTEIGHGGEPDSWPINSNGVDVSYYKNNDFGGPKSYHVLGEYAEHFLCYFRDKEFGLGHWAAYDEKPGQKIWIWGLSGQGDIWVDLLTDPGNVQYSEIQTGLLLNQAAEGSTMSPYKHQFFSAGSEHRFTELWFPVKEIGGMVKANQYGSLNVELEDELLKIGFCANQKIREELVVKVNDEEIFRKEIDLNPTEAIIDSIEIEKTEDIQIDIGNLISYNIEEIENRKLSKPTKIGEDFDWESPDGIFTEAVELEKLRNYKEAEKKYLDVLEINALHSGAINGLAGLFYRNMQYEKANEYVLKALSNDTYNAESNYIFALISKKLKRKYDALDGFSVAARSMEFRAVANTEIASIYFVDNEFDKCLSYVDKALNYNRFNINALKLKALTYEKLGRFEERKEILKTILEIDPLNSFARFELADNFKIVLNYEMPHEVCLEQAIYYYNLGLNDKAANILQATDPSPINYYWLAYILKDIKHLEKAVLESPILVYPYRSETAEILEWALVQNDDWKTKYYSGLLYWSKGRDLEAKKYFKECGEEPDFFAFYLTRYDVLKEELAYNGENDLLRAYELNKNEWRCYMALSDYYEAEEKFDDAIVWAKKGYSKFPKNYILAYQLSKTLLITGEYAQSLKVISKTNILPNEGAGAGRTTYRQACMMNALEQYKKKKYKKAISFISQSREWPKNLGVGKPYLTDERIEDYLESLCLHKMGYDSKAIDLESKIIDKAFKKEETFIWNEITDSSNYLSALLLRKSGNEGKAEKLLIDWNESKPNDLVAKWCMEKFKGNDVQSREVEREIIEDNGGTLFNPKSKNIGFVLVRYLAELD